MDTEPGILKLLAKEVIFPGTLIAVGLTTIYVIFFL